MTSPETTRIRNSPVSNTSYCSMREFVVKDKRTPPLLLQLDENMRRIAEHTTSTIWATSTDTLICDAPNLSLCPNKA